MNEQELISRADLALSDLVSTGGYLTTQQSNKFFRKMMDEPTILKDARVVPMARPKMEINKIGFGSRILRAATQGTISTPEMGETGTRALTRAQRYKPTTERVTLQTSEIIAEIDLPYEAIEDSIEGGDLDSSVFQQTILDMMAQRIALDLEELVILGDTSSGDSYLALQNGVIKQSVSNIVNQAGDPMGPTLFGNMIKALPTKYYKLLNRYRFYTSKPKEIDYRMTIAQRQTQLGDATLQGNFPISVLGVPLSSAALMPSSNAVLMIPNNLIIGVQRQLRMEFDKDIRERAFIIVVTMRLAVQFEEEDMTVKAINIG
ncbi:MULTISPECIES: phage major capsid protein [unclassified Bradyrhizobium]|uniref:phage major capsid protein n=1 Tax=unclassified Bradyrhizobium TaxID=2631580 RepID=UPI0033937C03